MRALARSLGSIFGKIKAEGEERIVFSKFVHIQFSFCGQKEREKERSEALRGQQCSEVIALDLASADR